MLPLVVRMGADGDLPVVGVHVRLGLLPLEVLADHLDTTA
jgi:hypothetical protein